MDETADYPSSPNLSDVDASESPPKARKATRVNSFERCPVRRLHSHSVPVVLMGAFLVADELFPD